MRLESLAVLGAFCVALSFLSPYFLSVSNILNILLATAVIGVLSYAAPGLPEAISFESRRHGGLLRHGIVAFLGFGRRNVADGLEQPAIVEPVHPLQRRELDSLK